MIDGLLGQHQPQTPDGMPKLDDPGFLVYEESKFAMQLLSFAGYGLTKASILALFIRIFDVKRFRIWPKLMLGVVAGWTISFFFASLFQCYPITALIEPFYGNKCVDSIALWYAGGISDIILDAIILVMPVPMVLRLKLPTKQKIGVIAMFLTGVL